MATFWGQTETPGVGTEPEPCRGGRDSQRHAAADAPWSREPPAASHAQTSHRDQGATGQAVRYYDEQHT